MTPETADLSTDQIVEAVRGGNVEAYGQIVVRYQGDVLKIVNAMLIDYSVREDVVQQVFIRAFQKIHQYQAGRGFGKWLKAITRNLVREELRKRYRYRGRVDAYAQLTLDRLELEDSEDDLALKRERQAALNDCIDHLEETAGKAVRLHYVEQWRTDEIAAEFKRTGGAIRTLLFRARGQLRECLEAKGISA